jgi:hypothetical protein
MATGIAAAKANAVLDAYVSDVAFVKLHVGDPGAAGANNAASVTTRMSLTWASASGGQKGITNTPLWSAWAGSNQTITHISLWDLVSAGVFKHSIPLATPVAVTGGGSFTLSSLLLNLGPIAA